MILPLLVTAMSVPMIEAQRQDLRCAATVAYALNEAEPTVREQIASVFIYYVGRLQGRNPTIDLEGEIRQVYADGVTFKARYASDLDRCSTEVMSMGKDLMRIGQALQRKP